MAYFIFTKTILEGKSIKVFNNGKMKRDFTYIDDIVGGVLAGLEYKGNSEVFNLGNDQPVSLMDFIGVLEDQLGKLSKKELSPIQPGDVVETWADIDSARRELGFTPRTDIKSGLEQFVNWFKNDYLTLNRQPQGVFS